MVAAGQKSALPTAEINRPMTHSVFIANPRNRIPGRNRNNKINQRADKISAKESELNQHGLKITQGERFFETRDENIIEHRHKSPHKKQDGHDGEWSAIRRAICR
ncbi:MAG: hypothetical protein WDM76_04475 [Limisphaerales bacterium]